MREIISEKIWRFFSTFWGSIYFVFVLINFFQEGLYDRLLGPLGTIYIASLGLFVGSKEFDRWNKRHPEKRNGEIFVILFTVMISVMFVLSLIWGERYIVSPDIVATYIGVLSVFAISHKSKLLYLEKKKDEIKN